MSTSQLQELAAAHEQLEARMVYQGIRTYITVALAAVVSLTSYTLSAYLILTF